jgi:hypothetical protein
MGASMRFSFRHPGYCLSACTICFPRTEKQPIQRLSKTQGLPVGQNCRFGAISASYRHENDFYDVLVAQKLKRLYGL